MDTIERIHVIDGHFKDRLGNSYPLRVSMEKERPEGGVIFTCVVSHEHDHVLRLFYYNDFQWEDEMRGITSWSSKIGELIENHLL